MPAVGGWLAAVWTGASAAGAVGAALLKFAVGVAINMAVAKIMAPKGPRPQELQTELRSSNAQRIRHLGRVRSSGAVMFWDWAYVGGERRLFKLLAVAQGGMSNVQQWYLDGEPVEVDANGYVTTAPWNKGNIRLRWRKGIQGDQWDGGDYADLRAAFPSQWTEAHRLRGVGTILATFDAVGGEDIAEVYSGGEPEVSALIDGAGAYWVLDGSTVNGRNPAVHLSDILTNPVYGALAPADIDVSLLAIARTDCSALVPTDGGTRSRYQSGISYALSDPIKDTAQKLLDAMGGRAWITPEGKLAVEAGVWRAPSITIEERHIVEMEYGAGTERINRVTTLVPTYVAPQVRWRETTADPVDDADAIARWGEGQPKSVDLLAVQHHGQAAHVCKQMLARMNPDRRMSIKLRAFGLRLIGERVVAVNLPRLGLASVPFWIDGLAFDGSNITVDLIEAEPASFDWTASEEGEPPAILTDIDRGVATRDVAISGVTLITDDGPVYIRIEGTLAAQRGDRLIAQYRRTGSLVSWTDMISEGTSGNGFSFRTMPLGDLSEYDFRVFFGRYSNGSSGRELQMLSVPVVVTGVDVVTNGNPPDEPVVISASGSAGDNLIVTFRVDLGANYHRTGLYRAASGAPFGSATLVKWSFDQSSQVTMTASIPPSGARFWLRSENESQVASDPVEVGNYPA
ncbi:hypothetical protein BDE18_3322 [Paracoccus pantotrophus]|uniref:Tip attachment protein J domain-containing protein n=1 Tax=Paracoccus pantotrophus TaxID=82367 RepID=A0AAE6NUU6_PARPN|nr:hypothetical protein [Paracoccus pantotrophus]QFG35328.1 hypothetical protein ESD82_03820 [Paracoccus pantotrophus]RKS44474.1 hypothetical protein BDE18_3322 [Paracoccus pantotrophus]